MHMHLSNITTHGQSVHRAKTKKLTKKEIVNKTDQGKAQVPQFSGESCNNL